MPNERRSLRRPLWWTTGPAWSSGWTTSRPARKGADGARHLPDADVMAAAGWRAVAVMRRSYQHTDAQGVFNAIQRAGESLWTQPVATSGDTNRLGGSHIPVKNMMCALGVPGYMIHG